MKIKYLSAYLIGVVSLSLFSQLVPGVCSQGTQDCGFNVLATTSRQTFNSPGFPNPYPQGSRCTWIFRATTPGNRIRIDFSSFTLARDYDEDNLNIRENGTTLFYFLGDTLPLTFVSSGESLEVEFDGSQVTQNTDVDRSGFQGTFQETSDLPTCGHPITATETPQTFYSPGYPTAFFEDTRCRWEIRASNPGSTISITFSFFGILSGDYDFGDGVPFAYTLQIEVDGRVMASSYELGSGPWISSGNRISVYFRPIRFSEENGFSATVTEIPGIGTTTAAVDSTTIPSIEMTTTEIPESESTMAAVDSTTISSMETTTIGSVMPDCGLIATATNIPQSINSPEFPDPYPQGSRCRWIFRTRTPGSRIRIDFSSFGLAQDSSSDDWLKFRENGVSLFYLFGDTLPRSFVSSGDNLELVFDGSQVSQAADVDRTGFRAIIRETSQAPTCGHPITATETPQAFYSPGYPTAFFENIRCRWEIQAGNPESTIRIEFEFYGLSDYDNGYVNENPATLYTLQIEEDGFVAVDKYELGLSQNTWTSSGDKISVIFVHLSFLEVDGFWATVTEIPKLSTTEAIPSSRTVPEVEAATSEAAAQICGFNTTATSFPQTISSPEFPDSYPQGSRCKWIFYAETPANRIRVDFLSFELSRDSSFDDWLKVKLNGASLFYLFGDTLPRTFVSSGDNLEIIFDGSQVSQAADVDRTGFRAIIRETSDPPTCGHLIITSGIPQTFYSPGYPTAFFVGTQCRWEIQAGNPGSTIRIEFYFYGLSDYDYGYADEYPVVSYTLQIEEYGRVAADEYELGPQRNSWTSSGNRFSVLFRPIRFSEEGGFSAAVIEIPETSTTTLIPDSMTIPSIETTTTGNVIPDCGFNATATSIPQSINSPEFPDPYPQGSRCKWIFRTGAPGSRIRIDFSSFQLARDSSSDDWLKLRENGVSLFYLFGDTLPRSFVSSGDNLELVFDGSQVSQAVDVARTGFRAVIRETNDPPTCGHLITATETPQMFYSPGYPTAFFDDTQCRWEIQAGNPGSTMRIEFYFYGLSDYDNGYADEYPVVSYTLQIEEYGLVATDEYELGPQRNSWTSSGNRFSVLFRPIKFLEEDGFSATVIEIPAPSTTTTAPDETTVPDLETTRAEIPSCDLLDLTFVLDSSRSVGPTHFERCLEFLRLLVDNINIGLTGTRVAIVHFDRVVYPDLNLTASTSLSVVKESIDKIEYSGDTKWIPRAFAYVGGQIFRAKHGNRAGAPDMAIVFTDGLVGEHAAYRLKKRGIRVVVIPMGEDVDRDKINEIASNPVEENIFDMHNVEEVVGVIRRSSDQPCPRD